MQDYSYFITLVTFVILFGFFVEKGFNFLLLLLYAETVWVLIYLLVVFLASLKGGNSLLILALFALSLGGFEFSVGLVILRLYKSLDLPILNGDLDYTRVKNKTTLKNFI